MRIERVGPRELESDEASLAELLVACVNAGAGIGFLAPISVERARQYWRGVAREVDAGHRAVLAARKGGALLGAVQLEFATRETGLHRAEVQKLVVHPSARRLGVAKALMARAEALATERGRSLLILDTFEGTVAADMYRRWGWTAIGRIPNYAVSPRGDLGTLVLFYKDIGTPSGPSPALKA